MAKQKKASSSRSRPEKYPLFSRLVPTNFHQSTASLLIHIMPHRYMELPNIKWIISVMFLSTTNTVLQGPCSSQVVSLTVRMRWLLHHLLQYGGRCRCQWRRKSEVLVNLEDVAGSRRRRAVVTRGVGGGAVGACVPGRFC